MSASNPKKNKFANNNGDVAGHALYTGKSSVEELGDFMCYNLERIRIREKGHTRCGEPKPTLRLSDNKKAISETDTMPDDMTAALSEVIDPGLRLLPHQQACMRWLGSRIGWKSTEHLLQSYGKWAEEILPRLEFRGSIVPVDGSCDSYSDRLYRVVVDKDTDTSDSDDRINVVFSGFPHGYIPSENGASCLVFAYPSVPYSVGRFVRDNTPARVTSSAMVTTTDEQSTGRMETGGVIGGDFGVPIYLCSIPTGLGKTMIGLAYSSLKAFLRKKQREEKNSSRFHRGSVSSYPHSYVLPQDMLSVPGEDMLAESTWDLMIENQKEETSKTPNLFPGSMTYPWTDCCLRGGVLVVVPPGGIMSTWEVTLKQWFPRLSLAKLDSKSPADRKQLTKLLEADVLLTDKSTLTKKLGETNTSFCNHDQLRWMTLPPAWRPDGWKHVSEFIIGVSHEGTYFGVGSIKISVSVHPLYSHVVGKETLQAIVSNYLVESRDRTQAYTEEVQVEDDGISINFTPQNEAPETDTLLRRCGLNGRAIDRARFNEQVSLHRHMLHTVSWSGIVVDEAHKWSDDKLRQLKILRADEIVLLTASMQPIKFASLHPVSPAIFTLRERLLSVSSVREQPQGLADVIEHYHIFHLDKDQRYEDTGRTLFESPLLSQHQYTTKATKIRKNGNSSNNLSSVTKQKQPDTHEPEESSSCKLECTWTIVPLESVSEIRKFYADVTRFLVNLDPSPDDERKWDPHGHAGKLLRLMYTAFVTGTVTKQSREYMDKLLGPTHGTTLSGNTDEAPLSSMSSSASSMFHQSLESLQDKLDGNSVAKTNSSISSGAVDATKVFVYPQWSSPSLPLQPAKCTECKRIEKHVFDTVESPNATKILSEYGLCFDRDTYAFSKVPGMACKRDATKLQLERLNQSVFQSARVGLYSAMCSDNQLVLPLEDRSSVADICGKLTWKEAKEKHKWLSSQRPEHLACILCGSTDPCDLGDLVPEDEEAWIIQPIILNCGHYFCAGCLQMMLNHQHRPMCPACRSPFRMDELRQLIGMPHTVDNWFDRLAKARHGLHGDESSTALKVQKKSGKKSKGTADDESPSKPLSRCSTADIRSSIDNAIKDLQELCSLGGEGEPTEHAPFSYPKIVQSVELKSRNSSIKLIASPQKRQRPQKKAPKKQSSRQSPEITVTKPMRSAIKRPRRAAASAAASLMDAQSSGDSDSGGDEEFSESGSDEGDESDCEFDKKTINAKYDKYIQGEEKYTFKARAAAKILREQLKPTEKALVFVSSGRSATYLKKAFEKLVPSAMILVLSGSVKCSDRGEIVNKFWAETNHEKSVLIVQYSAGGMGINLQTANHVVVVEPCTGSATQQQAIGRVWRLGQVRKIHVHVVASIGTIDHVALRRYARTSFNPEIPVLSEETFGLSLKHALENELPSSFALSKRSSVDGRNAETAT
eukprot:gb/GECG01002771.1/.p1 GENE.gb/GECG01002771.1/~~gb/GECG01002771.1/.p1  ORF type:complete len:1441 (+),score=164.87 gb/GECG01002771.1/:1-4323(+)